MYSNALVTGKDLPLGEALAMGGETTVIGLGIVFGVLIILMIVLVLMKVIFYKDPKKQKKTAPAPAPVETVPAAEVKAAETDEDELIAVLTAAIASSLNTSTYNLRIKSYRRTDKKAPAWNKAGLTETINNRF